MQKNIYIMAIILIFVINLEGCMNRGKYMVNWFESEQEIADERMEKIIGALEKKDAKALKEMFSKETVLEVEDLNEQIESLINFYRGDLVEYDGGCDSNSQNRHGKKKLEIVGKYKIVTTEEEYEVSFSEWVKEYEESEKIGVYNIEIAKEKTWEQEDFMWTEEEMGVYVME